MATDTCPYLYAILRHLADASDDPLVRSGICDTTCDSLCSVAFAFAGYHAVRRSTLIKVMQSSPLVARNELPHPEHPDRGSPFWIANLRVFAAAYRAEALSRGKPCRKGIGNHLEMHFGVAGHPPAIWDQDLGKRIMLGVAGHSLVQ